MKKSLVRSVAAALSVVYFATNIAWAHQSAVVELDFRSHATIWADRKPTEPYPKTPPTKLAALPANINAQLPSINRQFSAIKENAASISSRISNSLSEKNAQMLAPLFRTLPQTAGTIRKIEVPRAEPRGVVVHIQDVHRNFEAQTNIGNAVEQLTRANLVQAVALEGAFGPIDLSWYNNYPFQDSVKTVADYLLKEHRISGPIRAGMTAAKNQELGTSYIGIDDPTHYAANVRAVRAAKTAETNIKEDLEKQNRELAAAKLKYFSAALRDFDRHVEAYRRGNVSWGDHVEYLSDKSVTRVSPRIDAFLVALTMEKELNVAAIESERARLLEKLAGKLSKGETNELLAMSAAFRDGRLNHADFYSFLKRFCQQKSIDLASYRSFDGYVRYVLLCERLDVEAILEEVATLEKTTYSSLARTEKEKELVQTARGLYLAGKLTDFALTKEEWTEYRSEFITWGGKRPFEEFYKQAELRDSAMANNLIHVLRSRYKVPRTSLSILVTGGFHSTGIDRQLVDAGYTVVTYIPKISKVDDVAGSSYLSVFTQEKTPLDQLFAGEKLFLAEKPVASAAMMSSSVHMVNQINHRGAESPAPLDVPAKDVAETKVNGDEAQMPMKGGILKIRARSGGLLDIRFNPSLLQRIAGVIAVGALMLFAGVLPAQDFAQGSQGAPAATAQDANAVSLALKITGVFFGLFAVLQTVITVQRTFEWNLRDWKRGQVRPREMLSMAGSWLFVDISLPAMFGTAWMILHLGYNFAISNIGMRALLFGAEKEYFTFMAMTLFLAIVLFLLRDPRLYSVRQEREGVTSGPEGNNDRAHLRYLVPWLFAPIIAGAMPSAMLAQSGAPPVENSNRGFYQAAAKNAAVEIAPEADAAQPKWKELMNFGFQFTATGDIRGGWGKTDFDWNRTKTEQAKLVEMFKGNVYTTFVNDFDQKLKDRELTAKFLKNPTWRKKKIDEMVELAKGSLGVGIDFENMSRNSTADFKLFIEELAKELHAKNSKLCVIVEPKTDTNVGDRGRAIDWAHLAKHADEVQVMAYWYGQGPTRPDQIAPLSWIKQMVALAEKQGLKGKFTVALTTFGYDWALDGSGRQALSKTAFSEIEAQKANWKRYADGGSIYYEYTANDGKQHRVVTEDLVSIQQKYEELKKLQIPVVLWAFGFGDPEIFKWGEKAGLSVYLPYFSEPVKELLRKPQTPKTDKVDLQFRGSPFFLLALIGLFIGAPLSFANSSSVSNSANAGTPSVPVFAQAGLLKEYWFLPVIVGIVTAAVIFFILRSRWPSNPPATVMEAPTPNYASDEELKSFVERNLARSYLDVPRILVDARQIVAPPSVQDLVGRLIAVCADFVATEQRIEDADEAGSKITAVLKAIQSRVKLKVEARYISQQTADDFWITDEQLLSRTAEFLDWMNDGLAGERKKPATMIPEPDLVLPTGNEVGTSFVVSIGGTNGFLQEVTLLGHGEFENKGKTRVDILRYKQDISGIFDEYAQAIAARMGNQKKEQRSVGVVWAHPVEKIRGKVIARGLSKGWLDPQKKVVDQDIQQLFNDALRRAGLANVTVSIVVNDTFNPLAALSYILIGKRKKTKAALAGAILGTGSNEAFFVPGFGWINGETGADDMTNRDGYELFSTLEDKIVAAEDPVNEHRFEKRVAGNYLAKLFVLRLKAIRNGTGMFRWLDEIPQFRDETLDSSFLSFVADKNIRDLISIERKIREMYWRSRKHSRFVAKLLSHTEKTSFASDHELFVMYEAVKAIAERSARLLATHYAGIALRNDPEIKEPQWFAVEGSVFNKYPGYKAMVMNAIVKIVGVEKAARIELIGAEEIAQNLEGVGAAILAITAYNKQRVAPHDAVRVFEELRAASGGRRVTVVGANDFAVQHEAIGNLFNVAGPTEIAVLTGGNWAQTGARVEAAPHTKAIGVSSEDFLQLLNIFAEAFSNLNGVNQHIVQEFREAAQRSGVLVPREFLTGLHVTPDAIYNSHPAVGALNEALQHLALPAEHPIHSFGPKDTHVYYLDLVVRDREGTVRVVPTHRSAPIIASDVEILGMGPRTMEVWANIIAESGGIIQLGAAPHVDLPTGQHYRAAGVKARMHDLASQGLVVEEFLDGVTRYTLKLPTNAVDLRADSVSTNSGGAASAAGYHGLIVFFTPSRKVLIASVLLLVTEIGGLLWGNSHSLLLGATIAAAAPFHVVFAEQGKDPWLARANQNDQMLGHVLTWGLYPLAFLAMRGLSAMMLPLPAVAYVPLAAAVAYHLQKDFRYFRQTLNRIRAAEKIAAVNHAIESSPADSNGNASVQHVLANLRARDRKDGGLSKNISELTPHLTNKICTSPLLRWSRIVMLSAAMLGTNGISQANTANVKLDRGSNIVTVVVMDASDVEDKKGSLLHDTLRNIEKQIREGKLGATVTVAIPESMVEDASALRESAKRLALDFDVPVVVTIDRAIIGRGFDQPNRFTLNQHYDDATREVDNHGSHKAAEKIRFYQNKNFAGVNVKVVASKATPYTANGALTQIAQMTIAGVTISISEAIKLAELAYKMA